MRGRAERQGTMLSNLTPEPRFIGNLPGGGVMDTRCVYARGDRVRITQGSNGP